MNVADFVKLYEKKDLKKINKPKINSKDLKKYLNSFKKRFDKNRKIEGRGPFMKFLSDLEFLHNVLYYIEKKDEETLDKDDIKEYNKYYNNVINYLKVKDDVIQNLKLEKIYSEFKKFIHQ